MRFCSGISAVTVFSIFFNNLAANKRWARARKILRRTDCVLVLYELFTVVRNFEVYWNGSGCETPEDAVAKPMSMPGPVKDTGAETPISVRPPDEEAGSDIVTMGGTMKVPALAGAVQVNIAPLPCARIEFPETYTNPLGSPPVQVTVTPCERFTLVILAALVQAMGGDAVTCPWKAPTSDPPVPLLQA